MHRTACCRWPTSNRLGRGRQALRRAAGLSRQTPQQATPQRTHAPWGTAYQQRLSIAAEAGMAGAQQQQLVAAAAATTRTISSANPPTRCAAPQRGKPAGVSPDATCDSRSAECVHDMLPGTRAKFAAAGLAHLPDCKSVACCRVQCRPCRTALQASCLSPALTAGRTALHPPPPWDQECSRL
jgi:hypothetical protein